jgi:hypothetical protein
MVCQYLLRYAQGLGLEIIEVCQCRANGLSFVGLERFREQKCDSLLGPFAEALAHLCRFERYIAGSSNRLVPTVGNGIATTMQDPLEL